MSIAFDIIDTETSGNFFEINAARFVTVGGVTYLVTSPAGGQAVEVFQIGAGGTMTPVVQANTVSGAGTRQFSVLEVGGQTYLYWSAGNGVRVGSLDAAGQMTEVQTLSDGADPGDYLDTIKCVVTATVGGDSFVLVGGDALGLTVYAVQPDGSLSHAFNLADTPGLAVSDAYHIEVVEVGGTAYVVTAADADHGVSVLRLNADGSLTQTATLFDDASLTLRQPHSLASAVVGGVTYVIATGGVEPGMTVFALNPDGTIGGVQAQLTNAGYFEAVTTFEKDGKVFILASRNSPAFGLYGYELEPGGLLTAPGVLLEDGSGALRNVQALHLASIGGADYLVAPSLESQAVSVISVTHVGVAYDDSFAALEGQGVTGNLLADNGLQADRLAPGDQVAAVNGQAGAVGNQITLATGALLTVNADGSFVYDQNGAHDDLVDGASGAANAQYTETVTYTLTSGWTATLRIVLSGVDANHDILVGDNDRNTIHAGIGNDIAYGLDDVDGLFGEDGNDSLFGGGGGDTLWGGSGTDKLFGEDGQDTLHGGDGADRLSGGDGVDTLWGGVGLLDDGSNDYLDGGAGADYMRGSGGNDVYMVDDIGDTVVEFADEGYDIVRTDLDGLTLAVNLEALQLQGAADIDGTGNALANNIQGNSGANRLDGGEGVDTINGNDGDDTVVGGLGNDLLRGGTGADTFLVAHAFGPVLETDQIYDFSAAEGDILDLSGVFAGTLILVSAFSKQAGQMTLSFAGGVTTVRLDTTGDGRVDYQMKINGDVTGESVDWLL